MTCSTSGIDGVHKRARGPAVWPSGLSIAAAAFRFPTSNTHLRPQPNKLIAQDSAVSNPCYIPVTNCCPRPPIFARSIRHPEHPSGDCSPFYEPPRDQECPANKAGTRGQSVAGAVSEQARTQRRAGEKTGLKSFRHQNLSPCWVGVTISCFLLPKLSAAVSIGHTN